MNDALRVRGLEGIDELPRDGECFVDRDGATRQSIGEIFALDELEHQKRDVLDPVELMNDGDVGMIEGSQQLRFAFEALHALGVLREIFRQNFDRDLALQLGVGGAIDLAIPPLPMSATTLESFFLVV